MSDEAKTAALQVVTRLLAMLIPAAEDARISDEAWMKSTDTASVPVGLEPLLRAAFTAGWLAALNRVGDEAQLVVNEMAAV
jgi:hypothetical protein